MTDRPIIFSAPMVRALLDGRKTQTRRIITPQNFKLLGRDMLFHRPSPAELQLALHEDRDFRWLDGALSWTSGPNILNPSAAVLLWRGKPLWTPGDDMGGPGDRLWVRENCWTESRMNEGDGVRYPADGEWRVIENSPNASEAWCVMDQYAHARHPDNDTNCGQQVPSIHMPRWASRLTLHVEAVRVQRLHDISAGDAIAEGIAYPPKGMTMDEAVEYGVDPRGEFRMLWGGIHGLDAWASNPWVVAITFRIEHANIAKARGQA